ncbi:MAG: S8 family serine peptidase, partial [Limisphaerales bacterium]
MIELPPDLPTQQALEWFRQRPEVLAAEPNQRYRLHRTPNDPELKRLYGLERIGAPAAWDLTQGDAGVVVAVFDTGLDSSHPDLAPNLWKNPSEIPGNGVDDDSNGWVDDVHGIDVVEGDGNPFDDAGHGTHVAGTIGAAGDNRVGVAGVAWRVQLLAVRVLSVDGAGTTPEFVSAFDYAVRLKRRGVNLRVINCSWGGGFPSLALREAMAAAAAEGILMVCSAGNDGEDTDSRPAFPSAFDLPEIISVASSTACDDPSSFSNFGRETVDLAAPGSAILSTYRGGDRYAVLSGTSMAAPHVAGAAAVLFGVRPKASPTEIRAFLLGTTDPVPSWSGKSRTGGRLNLARAVEQSRAGRIPVEPAPSPRPPGRMMSVSHAANGRWGTGRSFQPSISEDGRWVAFVSAATNLVAGDDEGFLDVFLRDRETDAVERVSQTRSGAGGQGDSESPSVSADGRFVAFVSSAANLVPGDGNQTRDVFLWDRTSRQVEMISLRTDGRNAGNGVSEVPMVSRDGNLVVFASDATDLVARDGNQVRDVFIRDRSKRVTERLSVASDGSEALDWSDAPTMSGDGAVVAFHSGAPNLVPGDTNQRWDVFVRNRSVGRTEALVGALAGDDDSLYPLVSGDGKWVAFSSASTNFAGGATQGRLVLLLIDRESGRIVRPGGLAPGVLPSADNYAFGISRDGRFVSLTTDEPGLAPGGELGFYRTFLYDRLRDLHEMVAVSDAGVVADDTSFYGPVSGDGRFLAFVSNAKALVPGDGNAVGDVFVRDRGESTADLGTRVSGEAGFNGLGILHPLQSQRASKRVELGQTAEYDVSVANAGPTRSFILMASGAGSGWGVRAKALGFLEDRDLTTALTGEGGWTTPEIPAGGNLTLRVVVTRDGAPTGEAAFAVRVEARAASDGGVLDAVNLVSTTELSPPGWTLVSRGRNGAPAERSAESASANAAADRVAFSSESDQLDPRGDINLQSDVFLVDRTLGTVSRVSDASATVQGDGESRAPSLNADGTRVAFQSKASNLVPADSNDVEDIFVKDLAAGTTVRASVSGSGRQANRGSERAFLAANGRHLVFTSFASNLVDGDGNRSLDVFLRDTDTGTTECVSRSASGEFGDADSVGGVVSGDGRFVVFTSFAGNLGPSDRNGFADVYLRDRLTGAMELVSANTNGAAANGPSGGASISDDGRWVAFYSYAADIVPGRIGDERENYLLDRATGMRRLVSEVVGPLPDGMEVRSAVVSPDGRWLGIAATDSCGSEHTKSQVFAYDLELGRLDWVSSTRTGAAGDDHSFPVRFASGARHLLFESKAANLLSESATPASQVYLADLARAGVDALVKGAGSWGGEGEGTLETRPATVVLASAAVGAEVTQFSLRARNQGNTPDRFRIGVDVPAGVLIRVQGQGITSENSSEQAGAPRWVTSILKPGEAVDVVVILTLTRSLDQELVIPIRVESTVDAARRDWIRVTATADDDQDGMPDTWERRYFGNTTIAGLGTDGDGDGVTDAAEWLQNSDPTRPGDGIRLGIGAGPGRGEVRLTWRSKAGTRYRVERSPGLGAGFVEVGSDSILGTGGDLSWLDPDPEAP